MKFLILNGSPKGQYSITLQTTEFLKLRFGEHEFSVIDVAAKLPLIEKDCTFVTEKIKESDGIIFSYPVYTFLAPYQLHRVIEIIKPTNSLNQKFVTQITTSKHFFDTTAHAFIKENCLDMNAKFIDGLSQDMDDLLSRDGRKQAEDFFKKFLWQIQNDVYERNTIHKPYTKSHCSVPDKTNQNVSKRIVVLTDSPDDNLKNMIDRFCNKMPYLTEVVDLSDKYIRGGCLGCLSCATDGKCIYKDDYSSLLKSVNDADCIITAFTIRDHSLGSTFKKFDDREFCNGHRTLNVNKPFGYIISGNYKDEPNLQTLIKARADVGKNPLVYVATDEYDADADIDTLVSSTLYALKEKPTVSQSFYGVGGSKIFRDLVYSMRGFMRADHKFYKKNGYYKDFPQKKKAQTILMYLVGALFSNPKIKQKFSSKMKEGMLIPYKKVLNKEKSDN